MGGEHKYKFISVILAAGAGTRMKSSMPKVMHKLAGQPMISHVIDTLSALLPDKVAVVVAPHMDSVKETVLKKMAAAQFALQSEQKGTGHAVRCAENEYQNYDGSVLVLYGDTPLITSETLDRLLKQHSESNVAITLLGMKPESPVGYGRLVIKNEIFVQRIVECKDANAEEKKIPWVWAGVMVFSAKFLSAELPKLQPSKTTGEYYLTTLVEVAAAQKLVTVMVPVDTQEALGVNDRAQLSQAETLMQNRLREKAMIGGVTMLDPASTYLSLDTTFGRDVTVHPQVVFGPGVSVGDEVEIRSFSHIEGAQIEKQAIIGPFARVRPGSVIGEGAHVGNFVELKKTTLGKGAKANHLSYVGDTFVGEGANIGAGTITCNYDGMHKYETHIGAGAFIGSNSSLVAPITIGAGAIVGAGSVITEDVGEDELAITRAPQMNKPGKAKDMRQKQKK